MFQPWIAGKPLALLFGAAFFWAASHYPFQNTWLGPILVAYVVLLCWRRRLWLIALPALLPALDLAPWTGWFFVEEIDLLLLATAAFAYWGLNGTQTRARLPGLASLCMGAVTLAYLIACYRGWQAVPFDANALSNYLSPYNSLRLGKAWFWALILLPVLARDAGPALAGLRQYFIPGMLGGLALVSAADLWERIVFPGLSNFASDYRTTAPFSGMHTGGAALDGYLALSLPFVAAWLLTRQSRPKTAAALGLLALGAHAGLTTFSRGLFAAFAVSGTILALFPLVRALKLRQLRGRNMMLGALVCGLGIFALERMFAVGGYRGLLAALILLGAAMALSTWAIPRALIPASLLCAAALELVVGGLLASSDWAAEGIFKPPYLLFSLSALTFGALAWSARWRALSRGGASVALIAFFCLAANTLWIARHWGGSAASAPATLIIAFALLLVVLNARKRLWRLSRTSLSFAVGATAILVLLIPVSSSYYAGERFSSTRGDFDERLRHWNQVLDMMDGGAMTAAFGMGVGKFPVTYFWRNPMRETPATLDYRNELGNGFVRLTAPIYARGYGELLRLLQRVPLQPGTNYMLALDIRRDKPQARLYINLCARLLLYQQACVAADPRLLPADGQWHRYEQPLNSGGLGAGVWPLRAPTQLELAAEGERSALDIDNVSLRLASGGPELIRNGGFSAANDYWFFSSDRHHLPWHVKNLALNLYFELGWLGLTSFGALLALAAARLLSRRGDGRADAPVYLAALAGFLTVGLFDSLLDVPRLALLFFLVLFASLLSPSPSPERPPS